MLPIIARLMKHSYYTQADLATLAGLEQPTVALTLRRMERDGIIVRTTDAAHRRRSLIALTDTGRALSKLITSAAKDVEKIATRGLTAEERAEFFRLVEVMTRNLDQERYGERRQSDDTVPVEAPRARSVNRG